MRRFLWSAFAAVVVLSGGAALAETPVLSHGPKAAADAVLAAERAFEAESEKAGSAAAFRDFVDPVDGREFVGAGDPISGPAAIFAAHKDETGKLTWTPVEVFAAEGGDMGLTWGRWTYTLSSTSPKAITGRYVTVWRKTAGVWKAIIDIGNPDS